MSEEQPKHKSQNPSKSIERQKKIEDTNPPYRVGGTKTVWTPVTLSAYLAALQSGSSRRGACGIAGILPVTADNRMKKDPAFKVLVLEAEGKAEAFALHTIMSCIRQGSWKASSWILERRFPDQWSANAPMAHQLRLEIEELNEKIASVHKGKNPSGDISIKIEMSIDEKNELDKLRAELAEVESKIVKEAVGIIDKDMKPKPVTPSSPKHADSLDLQSDLPLSSTVCI